MRKISFLLIVFLFTACSSYEIDDTISKKYCWKFTLSTACTGLSTTTTIVEKCDLTEKQAEEARKALEGKGSYGTMTCTMTATKSKVGN